MKSLTESVISEDSSYMEIALDLARSGLGLTGCNPSVGCIITRESEIIGNGITGIDGVPHAEKNALIQAGDRARGSTLYTTLEPCIHHGKTGPCVDLIIDAGIKRVVIAISDPDRRVNGRGITKLTDKGIEVTCDVLKKEAFLSNIGYFYRKILGRPFVTIKVATTLDGKIASYSGKSKWITSSEMRAFSHKLRAQSSAIMVSYSTVQTDNPRLNCRLEDVQNKELIKVIIDSKGELSDPSLNLFSDGVVWSFGKANSFKHDRFRNIECLLNDGRVDLARTLQILASMEVSNLLIETGSKLFRSFLQENLFDEIYWFRANTIAGSDGLHLCADLKLDDPSDFIQLCRKKTLHFTDGTLDVFHCPDSVRLEPAFSQL